MNKRVILKGNIIKETNYKKILQLVGTGEHLTKLDIAYTLKISIPTVTTNINELKEVGIIEEVESDIYTGGRKPKIIKLIPNSRVSIGLSITKNKMIVIVMNLLNEVLLTKEVEFSGNHFIEYIKVGKELVKEIIEELKVEEEQILGIGISIPGTINEKTGMAEQTNMGYKDIPLDEIYNMFEYSVYIENEANLSLLAEKTLGGYGELKNLLYLGINEGLGGGIFVNGELFRGTSGRAGEFGRMHLALTSKDKTDKVEDYISTRGLVARYNERSVKTVDSFVEFEEIVKSGDPLAHELLNEGIEILIMTIYNLTMVLDIQKIILGGKVGRLIKSQILTFEENISKYKNLMDKLGLDITFSEIRNTTTMGATLLPLTDFYRVSNENE